MTAAWISSRWRALGDWRIPLLIAPFAIQEMLAAAPENFPDGRLSGTLYIALGLICARWARERPRAVMVAMLLGSAVWAVAYTLDYQPPFSPAITLVVTIFSLEAYDGSSRARALLATFAVYTLIYCVLAEAHGVLPSGDLWAQWMLWALALAAGVVVRLRREENVALEDHAGELLRMRDERARQAVQEERARIARELHDVIAHSVSVMVIQASVERRAIAPGGTHDVLGSIETTGRQTLGELRRLLGILRHDGSAPGLAPQPDMRGLRQLVEQVGEAGLDVELDVAADLGSLAAGLELSAYRIVQEALTNTLKHAEAQHARVTVRRARGQLELEIVDDGNGPAVLACADGSGHGLVGMRERASLYGGSVQTGRSPSGGFRVWASLPIEDVAS